MKKLLVLSMVLVMTAVCSSAMAQMKVATIDIQRCIIESDAGKKVRADLIKMQQDNSTQFQTKRNEIDKLQKDYQDQEKALSEAAKKQRIEEIQAKAIALENDLRNYNTRMQQTDMDATMKMTQELESVIDVIAKADKYDLVLLSQAVAYAPNAEDITLKVIDQYNKQQPK